MTVYVCDNCEYDYDPEIGDPETDIEEGVSFQSLPSNWVCPDCGSPKSQFFPIPEDDFEDEAPEEDQDEWC